MSSRSNRVKIIAGWLVVGGLLVVPGAALADFTEHVGEAIEHADAAVKHGKLGHADMLVEHADGALRYAKEARKLIPSPQLDDGIAELEAAISEGNAGRTEQAVQHAEKARGSLSAVK